MKTFNSVPIGRNTIQYSRDDGARVIRFYETDIITFHANGDFTLRNGGHETQSTARRINAHLPYGYSVKAWRLYCPGNVSCAFEDGMTISPCHYADPHVESFVSEGLGEW